ncbi:MAG TPA: acyltransferase [Dehalococcoidia bacterium]
MEPATAYAGGEETALRLPFRLIGQKYRIPAAASASLDGCRALAALAVMLFHLRHLFFVDDPSQTNAAQWAAYKATSPAASHLAVMVFFVMSGYLISTAIFRARAESRWSLTDYSIARLTRLWVVLLPALVLGAVLDQAGQRLFEGSGVYTGLPSDFAVLNLATPGAHFSLLSLLGNAAFLQDTRLGAWAEVTRFGSNGPLWSLAYEFTYYVLFPALLLVAWFKGWLGRFGALAIAVAVAFLAGGTIVTYFSIWLFGAAIAWLPRLRFASRGLYLAAVVLASVAASLVVVVAILPDDAAFRWDVIVGAFFAGWIYVLGCSWQSADEAPPSKDAGLPALKFFADFSFSLYVLHMPMLVFLHAWAYEEAAAKWQPDALHALVALAIATGVVLYALAVASVTEFHTDKVRRGLRRRFEQRDRTKEADAAAVGPQHIGTPG